MKKLFILTSVIAALATSAAQAKTEGSSVGLTLFKAEAKHTSSLNHSRFEDDSYRGVSLGYKYAVSLPANFYVAPGVSYDHIGTVANNSDSTTATDKVNLNNRFNLRADIGYDINENLAGYVVVGGSAIGTEVYNHNGSFSEKKNSYNMAMLYGAGFKSMISKNLDLVFEYTHQDVNLRSSTSTQKAKTTLQTVGIGLAYNF